MDLLWFFLKESYIFGSEQGYIKRYRTYRLFFFYFGCIYVYCEL